MSDTIVDNTENITFQSTRFGEVVVPKDSIIEFPAGIIGVPSQHRYVMLEYNSLFSWLHCVDDPNLAFVVVEGYEFGDGYQVQPPIGDRDIDLKEDDEYAILVIITIRRSPDITTANLKAPIFVNIRNRKAAQIIFDDPKLSIRHPFWKTNEEGEATVAEADDKGESK